MCVREIARVRERRALFVSGYACLCGHVWKLEVDVSMFSPITFPSCVLRPGFSLNLEQLTILVIRSSNLRDPTGLHLSVLGLYTYIPQPDFYVDVGVLKIRSSCSCCRHRIYPFPQPRSIDYGTTQASEEDQGNRIIRASGCFSAVTVEICWMIPSV